MQILQEHYSLEMREYLLQYFFDVLFYYLCIFSLESDIKFASLCGYQKLLVLTGATKIDDISKCEDKELIPDYYLSSLGDLSQLIKDKLNV